MIHRQNQKPSYVFPILSASGDSSVVVNNIGRLHTMYSVQYYNTSIQYLCMVWLSNTYSAGVKVCYKLQRLTTACAYLFKVNPLFWLLWWNGTAIIDMGFRLHSRLVLHLWFRTGWLCGNFIFPKGFGLLYDKMIYIVYWRLSLNFYVSIFMSLIYFQTGKIGMKQNSV